MVIPDDCCDSNRCCANTYAVVPPPMAITSPGATYLMASCAMASFNPSPSATLRRTSGSLSSVLVVTAPAVHTLQQTLVGQIGDIASDGHGGNANSLDQCDGNDRHRGYATCSKSNADVVTISFEHYRTCSLKIKTEMSVSRVFLTKKYTWHSCNRSNRTKTNVDIPSAKSIGRVAFLRQTVQRIVNHDVCF